MKAAIADRVLILMDEPEDSSVLELREEEKAPSKTGTVVLVGPGVINTNIKMDINITGEASVEALAKLQQILELVRTPIPVNVAVGDRVMFGFYSGTRIQHEGKEHLMIRSSDILGFL